MMQERAAVLGDLAKLQLSKAPPPGAPSHSAEQ